MAEPEKLKQPDDSEVRCDRCGQPKWKHHYFHGFGLLGGNGDHVYKPVEQSRAALHDREEE